MRKKRKQEILLLALLLIMSLAGTGCGEGGQPESPARSSQAEGTERVSKEGALSYGYFFEEDGIVVSSKERFLYSDWEPVEFDYICTDPICSHQVESCSARTVQDEKSMLKDFSLIYRDRLIILHTYFILEINQSSETVQEWNHIYQMDVYEADLDGSNRRKVAAFSGGIGIPHITHAAVLADGKLYFGGPTEEREKVELGAQGEWLTFELWTSAAFYCLDLNDYTVETYMIMENKEGDPSYLYQVYEYDGMLYWMINFVRDDSAVLYRSTPGAGVCEEILRFDSYDVMFGGVIGDTVYYWYESSRNTLRARDISAGAEEREIMTVPGADMFASPFVVDGQLLLMREGRMEEKERMTEYVVLDPQGKIVDTIRYDDYITFLDAMGDRIIYFRPDSDAKWEVWWAYKEDLKNLSEKGVRIGPYNGWRLDTLED